MKRRLTLFTLQGIGLRQCGFLCIRKTQRRKGIEFRPPDCTANPYLAFSAILMAVIDGITNKMDPGDPTDINTYDFPPGEAKMVPTVPGSLESSIAALKKDYEFLLRGGVFTQDVIDVWIEYKKGSEIDPIRLRPHPYEFYLYFDM